MCKHSALRGFGSSTFALPPCFALSNALTQAKPPVQTAYQRISRKLVPLNSHYHCLDFSRCRSGIQPSSWKVANVVPIRKKKSRSALSNYRNISLLPILSKVMETIVNCSVTNFLERNSILSPCQFGFRGCLSTADLQSPDQAPPRVAQVPCKWRSHSCVGN